MSDSVIRRHRPAAQEDMHDRLRRLLYEAFYGIEFDAPVKPQMDRRPRLLLVKPAGRTTRTVRRDAPAESTGPAPDADAPSVQAWSAPRLYRMP